jgi:uncharacterized membrane protein
MSILCPHCKNVLLSINEVNTLLPLKRFGLSEVKCSHCEKTCISAPKPRGVWFIIFMATLITLMVGGKQLVHLLGYNEQVSIFVLITVYFLVNGLFSYIWPRVITIKLKNNSI